ncbi:HD domain-containing protein [Brevifollis gellanilyticus]|uniref:HDIG domain-containing protein n=1 Tax=Brevifollis gellanilyticus TaxID=748831 RepID=A0A512M9H3_9BACT|nr:HD domain-containing protein [Brevifollis gellanilyticus]GEP43397.1 HDIG domain-containing protein [Brevifollis gellanilyticus]
MESDLPDLITITQLRQIAGPTPQPYRIQVQVDNRNEKLTSGGSPFFEIKLADGGDSLLWRLFDSNPIFDEARSLTRGSFVEITAQWVDTGKYGIEPRHPRLRPLTEEEKGTLLGGDPDLLARQRIDYADIERFVAAIRDPRLRGVSSLFLEKHGERFRRTAAARENHHARRGGLVEHVAQMMRSALAIASTYPTLNQDLLVAGVLFHDCGKLWENSYPESSFAMPYHLHGEMLGHITLGLELMNKLWRDLLERPEATAWATLEPANEHVRLHLLHLIASHHGEYQYGSPVLPKTPEALVLHHVDNIDAKMEMFRRGYENSRELAPGIFERFRPWPVNVVAPLSSVPPASPATE